MITANQIINICENQSQVDEFFPELVISEVILALTETFNTAVFHILKPFYKNVKSKYPEIVLSEANIIDKAKQVLRNFDWKRAWVQFKQFIKKHGWKIGVTLAFWELFKLYILPAICSLSGFPEIATAFRLLPIGELTIVPLFEKLYDIVSMWI